MKKALLVLIALIASCERKNFPAFSAGDEVTVNGRFEGEWVDESDHSITIRQRADGSKLSLKKIDVKLVEGGYLSAKREREAASREERNAVELSSAGSAHLDGLLAPVTPKPLTALRGIQLGMSSADIKAAVGRPEEVEKVPNLEHLPEGKPERLLYHYNKVKNERPIGNFISNPYFNVELSGDEVVSILTRVTLPGSVQLPEGINWTVPDSMNEFMILHGKPDRQSDDEKSLVRTCYYDDKGLVVMFKNGSAMFVGCFNKKSRHSASK